MEQISKSDVVCNDSVTSLKNIYACLVTQHQNIFLKCLVGWDDEWINVYLVFGFSTTFTSSLKHNFNSQWEKKNKKKGVIWETNCWCSLSDNFGLAQWENPLTANTSLISIICGNLLDEKSGLVGRQI